MRAERLYPVETEAVARAQDGKRMGDDGKGRQEMPLEGCLLQRAAAFDDASEAESGVGGCDRDGAWVSDSEGAVRGLSGNVDPGVALRADRVAGKGAGGFEPERSPRGWEGDGLQAGPLHQSGETRNAGVEYGIHRDGRAVDESGSLSHRPYGSVRCGRGVRFLSGDESGR